MYWSDKAAAVMSTLQTPPLIHNLKEPLYERNHSIKTNNSYNGGQDDASSDYNKEKNGKRDAKNIAMVAIKMGRVVSDQFLRQDNDIGPQ